MESQFWLSRWAENRIGFHQDDFNPFLVKYFQRLKLDPGNRIFVPLCGKTKDIAWLLQLGYRVVGAELAEAAVIQLFEELALRPETTTVGNLIRYHAEGLEVYVGDFFALDFETLGPVDGVYDRAALVALPFEMRRRYTDHLRNISGSAPQLLIAFEYDQNQLEGPPFAIPASEIAQHYRDHYEMVLLDQEPLDGGLKGKVDAVELIWHLR
ncbi:thiopurine S-methyltransferase [Acanthopleuribacter pedis]|uniref:Thiopurine S-methyltransferase n=1 Tax=Acanthopleuribacter pedis TaxID=442870 RepID=A0A8J7QD95_9BACT|nr:thiopurine S-methyltransferase [Acanthopleuribacter pedis]MBO1316943.1 thiopurine S-methyltransferase [Acanthopleuribacter pedis]